MEEIEPELNNMMGSGESEEFKASAGKPLVAGVQIASEESVIDAIRTVYDPEIPVNIYELGLIYDIAVDKNNISVKMTLTSPNCPVAESLPKEVKDSIMQLEEVDKVDLDLVWEPPWDKSMMSEAAKLELNL